MDINNVKAKIKLLIPNDYNHPSYNELIDLVVDKVQNDIANYTHIPLDELPEELSHTAIGMCTTLITTEEILVPLSERSNDGIASIDEGNEKVAFKSKANEYLEIQNANEVTRDYKKQLNRFRRIDFG